MKKIAFALVIACVAVVGYGTYRAFWWAGHDPKTQEDYSKLVVYASSSFINSYGPAQDLKKLFEPQCNCQLEFIDAGGGAMLLQRLQLQPNARVDVVLGLDLLMLSEAAKKLSWRGLKFDAPLMDPNVEPYRFAKFVAYDWAPISVIYNSTDKEMAALNNKFENLSALVRELPKASLALPDPRLSSLGEQFVFWSYVNTSDITQFFSALKPKLHSQSSGWSQSYGLFRAGQARAALSYTTSLVYHRSVEKDFSKVGAEVTSGHPVQVEYGAVTGKCVTCRYAEMFLAFLVTEPAQKILMEKNFMYPVRSGLLAGTEYEKIPMPKLLGREQMDRFVEEWPKLVELWGQQW